MLKSLLLSGLPLALVLSGPALAEPAAGADPAAPAASSDLAKQLADVQDKLGTALHSYSLLQDENSQLKAAAESAAAEKTSLTAQLDADQHAIETLKGQAAVAPEVDSLRTQLRQALNEVAALAEENAQLKTRLALAGPGPGSAGAAPTRPGAAAAALPPALEAPPVAAPPASAPAAAAPADPRTYVVVAGDTLGKISRQFYGTATRYEEIVAANRDVIHDENNLQVGMKLKIP
jgi:nucleoid-associated protein YgaU